MSQKYRGDNKKVSRRKQERFQSNQIESESDSDSKIVKDEL